MAAASRQSGIVKLSFYSQQRVAFFHDALHLCHSHVGLIGSVRSAVELFKPELHWCLSDPLLELINAKNEQVGVMILPPYNRTQLVAKLTPLS